MRFYVILVGRVRVAVAVRGVAILNYHSSLPGQYISVSLEMLLKSPQDPLI
jgi:hypothetical protein